VIRILESKQVGRLLARKAARFTEAAGLVRPILDAVRQRGDRALMEYARQFDALDRKSVRVPPAELRAARERLTRITRERQGSPSGRGAERVHGACSTSSGAIACERTTGQHDGWGSRHERSVAGRRVGNDRWGGCGGGRHRAYVRKPRW